jgi:hypothetical protein
VKLKVCFAKLQLFGCFQFEKARNCGVAGCEKNKIKKKVPLPKKRKGFERLFASFIA